MCAMIAGNQVELLCNGEQFFPALESAFDAARTEIYLVTYIFEDDATGRRIAEALMRAARRGVAAHVLIDGFGSKDLSDEFLEKLAVAGVQVLKYRPDVSPWTFQRERLRRLHSKITVVDGALAFVGGINIIDDMHTPNQTPPRFDYAVRVCGPLLADIYPVVLRLWRLTRLVQIRQRWPRRGDKLPQSGPCGNQKAAFVIRDNLRHRQDIEQAYLEAIAAARTEIVIANAYFFPGRNFRRALIDAAARGVRVVLLLQGRVEYLLLHYASRALYRTFLGAGVEIFEYRRSFLHAKVAVIDYRWATVGSSNIDPMSLLLAREANVVIDDEGFAHRLRLSLSHAMELGAQQVLPSSWERVSHSWSVRLMTRLCYWLVRFLTGWSSYGRGGEFK